MVELHLNARLGNNMFQYALARRLADELGCGLETVSRTNPEIPFEKYFRNAPLSIERSGYQPRSAPIHLHEEWYQSLNPDIESIINAKPERIIIDGYFENYKLLAPFAPQLHSIFHRPLKEPTQKYMTIHLRLGDVAEQIAMSHEYIDFAVAAAKHYTDLPVSIVAESPKHPDVIDTFDYLRSATVQIATNSTLTWWTSFLSPHTTKYIAVSKQQPISFKNKARYLDPTPPTLNVYDLDAGEFLARYSTKKEGTM